MSELCATMKAWAFCLKNIRRGYRVQKLWLGFHGPCVRVQVLSGETVVRTFFERPDYTESELRQIEAFKKILEDEHDL